MRLAALETLEGVFGAGVNEVVDGSTSAGPRGLISSSGVRRSCDN
jgi:hypothetical protein